MTVETPTREAVKTRPHVSFTQISMIDECSLRWWLRYVCKIRKLQSIQMMTGDVVHKVLAKNFREKAYTGTDILLDDLLDEFVSIFDLKLLERCVDIKPNQNPANFKEAGIAVVTNYIKNIAPPLVPMMIQGKDGLEPAVEIELRRQIPGTEYDYLGYLDLMLHDRKIIDYKVIGRKWSARDELAKKKQACAYGFLVNGTSAVEDLQFDFHCCIRDAKNPRVITVSADQSPNAIKVYVAHTWNTLDTMEGLRVGSIPPRVKDGFCSIDLCGHFNECKQWKLGTFDPDDYNIENNAPSGELIEEEDL